MSTVLDSARTAQLPRKPSGAAPFVLFSGGKGGVGKTLLAANTAALLSARGRRVLLVDLDLGLADLDVLLRITPRHTIEDALSGRVSLAECVVPGPGGLSVLAASSGSVAMGQLDAQRRARLFAALFELASDYELLVGDGAAGIGPDVLDACVLADHVLVVTTPEPSALTDAYGLMKALHARSEEHGREMPTPELLVNLAPSCEEAERTAVKLRGVCERFLARSPRTAGWMPSSPLLSGSVSARRPFALENEQGLPGKCLARLASRLERLCLGAGPRAGAQARLGHGR